MLRVAKYAVVFSLSTGLCMANTAGSMSGIMSGLGQVTNTLQQVQTQRQEQATQERALAQEEAQINSTVNQNTNNPQTSPYTVPQNLPNASNGYPILDPYANAQYWTQRGHQFKFSMDVAGKRAELQNKKAKMMLEAEKKKTAAMLQGLGQVMKVAGDQMTVIGNNRAQAQQQEQSEARSGLAQRCGGGDSTCREEVRDGRTVVIEQPTGNGDETPEPVVHEFENDEALNSFRDQYDLANRSTTEGLRPHQGGFKHNGEVVRDDSGNIVRDQAEALRIVQAREQAAEEAARAEEERVTAAREAATQRASELQTQIAAATTRVTTLERRIQDAEDTGNLDRANALGSQLDQVEGQLITLRAELATLPAEIRGQAPALTDE